MDQDKINQRIDKAQNTDKNGGLDEYLYKKVREEIGGLSESKTKLHRTIWKFLSKTADHWNPDNSIFYCVYFIFLSPSLAGFILGYLFSEGRVFFSTYPQDFFKRPPKILGLQNTPQSMAK